MDPVGGTSRGRAAGLCPGVGEPPQVGCGRDAGGTLHFTATNATPEELQSAIDITLQRFAEYHSLQAGAFAAARADTISAIPWLWRGRWRSTADS